MKLELTYRFLTKNRYYFQRCYNCLRLSADPSINRCRKCQFYIKSIVNSQKGGKISWLRFPLKYRVKLKLEQFDLAEIQAMAVRFCRANILMGPKAPKRG